jgi:hypothetical protein
MHDRFEDRGDMRYGSVYFLLEPVSKRVKIGWTMHLRRRIRALQLLSPIPVTLLGSVPGRRMHERHIHLHLKEHRLQGEWFEFEGSCRALIEKTLTNNLVPRFLYD